MTIVIWTKNSGSIVQSQFWAWVCEFLIEDRGGGLLASCKYKFFFNQCWRAKVMCIKHFGEFEHLTPGSRNDSFGVFFEQKTPMVPERLKIFYETKGMRRHWQLQIF